MSVLRLDQVDRLVLLEFLQQWQLHLVVCDPQHPIPGSFWGDDEAGLIGNKLYAWPTTPIHSIFHEACHYICMDEQRRAALHTNAGSDVAEENAVCYLQILLAEQYPEMSKQRMFDDMDSWGYSFRLGSSRAWFEEDAEDAKYWLIAAGLLDSTGQTVGQLRFDKDQFNPVGIQGNIRSHQSVA